MAESVETTIARLFDQRGLWLAVAESCTGGLIGHYITNMPGASTYFKGGVIAYANDTKMGLLGVSGETLERYGAVSEATVLEMAGGVRDLLKADIGLSVSGIAGPGGGTPEKPVGLVWIGLRAPRAELARQMIFSGDRISIKQQAAEAALKILIAYLRSSTGNDRPKQPEEIEQSGAASPAGRPPSA
jgi:PncC family amidohydrolase